MLVESPVNIAPKEGISPFSEQASLKAADHVAEGSPAAIVSITPDTLLSSADSEIRRIVPQGIPFALAA